MSVEKVMFVIFFSDLGPSIQIAVPKGKSVNAKFCKGNVFHKLKKYSKIVDQQMVSVVSGCCMAMLRHTKRQLFESA
jgi:hypothetical protein